MADMPNRRFTLDLEKPALVSLNSPSHAREETAASIDAARSAEGGGGPGYGVAPVGYAYTGAGGELEKEEWLKKMEELGREITDQAMDEIPLEDQVIASTVGFGFGPEDAYELVVAAIGDPFDPQNRTGNTSWVNPSGDSYASPPSAEYLFDSHNASDVGTPPIGSDSAQLPALFPLQPAWQVANLSERVKRKINKLSQPFKNSPGFFNQRLIEPESLYADTGAETVTKGLNNSFIIMGRDRVGTSDDGYGHGPSSHAGAIDLIAGLSGPLARSEQEGATVKTNKSFALDSARIYLSAKCDVDDAFALKSAEEANHWFGVRRQVGKSAIALKADGVRVIARTGIKLVTGTDGFDARGNPADVAGVDIIAGNDVFGLQPMVKGHDLLNLLQAQFKFIEDIIDELFKIRRDMLISELENLFHFHISTVPGAPTIPAPSPTKLMKFAKYGKYARMAYQGWRTGEAMNSLWGASLNSARLVAFRKEYLDYDVDFAIGKGVPLSKWNNVN